jgi:hypothetical protein
VFEAMTPFAPPLPEGVPSPRDWGAEEIAEERLAPLASSLQMRRRTMHWEWDSFDALWETFQAAGPGAAARKALSPEKLEEAKQAVREVIARWNLADDGPVVVEPAYLEIVARKRG